MAKSKPFKEYPDLVSLIKSRGMKVSDDLLAQNVFSQVGYYRLSGFWYPTRKFKKNPDGSVIEHPTTKNPVRDDGFEDNVSFNEIYNLYLFDKKLRLLFIDAIEQIEIHLRSIIAHEMSRNDPLAYKDSQYINPKFCKSWTDKKGKIRNIWNEWLLDSQSKIDRSKEDCINWYRLCKRDIPFWVAIEAWDFGTLSRYYSILKGTHQKTVASRLSIIIPGNLTTWLREINTLRNRCAHHTRIWNQGFANALPIMHETDILSLSLGPKSLTKNYGLVAIIWFLLKSINGESDWIYDWISIIENKPDLPGCSYTAMGFPKPKDVPLEIIDM